jgi:peptide subunit release factor 1 (eRF1)
MTVRTHPSKPTASDQLIERLSRLESRTPTVVSCYLKLDAAARRNRAYLVDLLNRVRDLESTVSLLELDRADRERVAADIERIVRWLALPKNLPHLAGVAVFASKALGLFETVLLPRVHRNRIAIDTRPLLHELLDARERLGHYLGVVIDRSRARFFHVAATGAQELNALVPVSRRGGKYHSDRADAPGQGEFRYHQQITAEQNRHYAATAREIARLLQARPYRGFAVFGPDTRTSALLPFLPPRLTALCIGTGRLNPTAVTETQVARAVWDLESKAERRDEAALVDRVEEAVPTGWAVNGARETLRALGRGQVRELIVPEGASGAGFRCDRTGQLVLSAAECRGDRVPVPHLVDHAIEDALRQGSQVVIIDDAPVAARIDGMAATFRFRSR